MNIGTLAQVILDEDAQSAMRKRRIINRKVTGRDFTYDGSEKDYNEQIRRRSTKKQFKRTQADIKKTGFADDAKAAYDRGSNLIGVNKNDRQTNVMNDDGTINRDSPVYKHEDQHSKQFKIMRKMAGGGRNAQKKYDKLSNRALDSYHLDDLKSPDPEKRKKAMTEYLKNPLEYDANVVATSDKTPKDNSHAVRAVKQALGKKTEPVITSAQQGLEKNNELGLKSTRGTRQISEKDIPQDVLEKMQKQEKSISKLSNTIQQIKKNNMQIPAANQQQQMVQRPVVQQPQQVQQPAPQPQPVQQAAQYQPPQQVQTPYIQKYQQPVQQPQPQFVQPQPQMVQRPVVQQTQPVQQPVQQQMVQRQRPVQQTNPNSINSVKPMNRQMAKNNNFRSA